MANKIKVYSTLPTCVRLRIYKECENGIGFDPSEEVVINGRSSEYRTNRSPIYLMGNEPAVTMVEEELWNKYLKQEPLNVNISRKFIFSAKNENEVKAKQKDRMESIQDGLTPEKLKLRSEIEQKNVARI